MKLHSEISVEDALQFSGRREKILDHTEIFIYFHMGGSLCDFLPPSPLHVRQYAECKADNRNNSHSICNSKRCNSDLV